MKVTINIIDDKNKEQVIIECAEVTEDIEMLCGYASSVGNTVSGNENGRIYTVDINDILYFEALDEKVFACTAERVLEVRARLYEIEERFKGSRFIRCSKSFVINLMQLESISPALNGRFMAHMKNGENVIISRQYVPALKRAVLK